MPQGVSRRLALVATLLAVAALLLRLPSAFQSVISWDESLYLIAARQWLDGGLPYIAVWDHKPPGMFAWFALALWLLGDSVLSIRVASWLAVTVTACLLYAIARALAPARRELAGLTAGGLYLLATIGRGGLAGNAEIFFAPFMMGAAALMLARPGQWPGLGRALGAGALIGLALLTKWLAAWDAMALGLLVAFAAAALPVDPASPTDRPGPPSAAGPMGPLARRLVLVAAVASAAALGAIAADLPGLVVAAAQSGLASLGALALAWGGMRPAAFMRRVVPVWGAVITAAGLAVVASWAYFAAHGAGPEYLDANFAANARYTAETAFSPARAWRALDGELAVSRGLWVAVALASALAVLPARWTRVDIAPAAMFASWAWLALPAACLSKLFFPHYFLQTAPAQSLCAGLLIASLWARTPRVSRMAWTMGGLVAALLVADAAPAARAAVRDSRAYVEHRVIRREPHWGDRTAEVAAYLRSRLRPGELIYVADGQLILYHLLRTPLPTRYVFPPVLYWPPFSRVARIDADAELAAILARRPAFVVWAERSSPRYAAAFEDRLRRHLGGHYELDATIHGVSIYRRTPG